MRLILTWDIIINFTQKTSAVYFIVKQEFTGMSIEKYISALALSNDKKDNTQNCFRALPLAFNQALVAH
jgi:hypothetical protein